MLSLEYRPKTFSEMAGQNLVKKNLMHISKDPISAPKTILLCGAFGTGKTTAARIFARALNCPNKLPNGDACGRPDCPICGQDIQDSMFYSEYDSAIVGNVKDIKELRNTFYFGYNKGFKVIVLDEVHLISKQAQGALLKVIEEPEPNVFYILCTTDPDKLLNTITSRSLELRYNTVEPKDMIPFLEKVLTDKGVEITDDIKTNLTLIAARSDGHMRNAMMLLDSMLLLQEDFRETVEDSTGDLVKLIKFALQSNTIMKQLFQKLKSDPSKSIMTDQEIIALVKQTINQSLLSQIDKLNHFDTHQLLQDYLNLIARISRNIFGVREDEDLLDIVKDFKNNYTLINILNDRLIIDGFNSSTTFQTSILVLFNKLKELKR